MDKDRFGNTERLSAPSGPAADAEEVTGASIAPEELPEADSDAEESNEAAQADGENGDSKRGVITFEEDSDAAESAPSADPDSVALAEAIARSALLNRAMEVEILDVARFSPLTDVAVICSGRSDRQVRAIAEKVQQEIRRELGVSPVGVEGESGGQWVLLDYRWVVLHVFYEHARGFYDLEGLWSGAKRLPPPVLEPPAAAAG